MNASAPVSASRRLAAARLLAGYSIEITGADRSVAETCEADLPAGTEVFIAFVPGESHARVIAAARRVRQLGLTPVPHIVARSFEGPSELDDLLGRFADDAGVRSALVIAGDRAQPAGPYHSTLQLLETGLFEKRGITRLCFACHPEAHSKVDAATMREALRAKIAYARSHGLEPRLVSQFALEAAPVLNRLGALGEEAPGVPIRIGIAGPTSKKTLWKYALYCGIGSSLRALGSQGETLGHLLLQDSPDALLGEIATGLERGLRPAPAVQGIHIFTFGGVAKAVAWANQLIAEADRAATTPTKPA